MLAYNIKEKERFMTTTIGTEHSVIDTLNNLTRLGFDAIEAYQAAVDRLDDATNMSKMLAFKEDHERHTLELSMLVSDLGGKPARQADANALLTRGKVVLRGITGDRGILAAMKSNEDDTTMAYEQALHRGDITPQVREILRRNYDDERHHRTWIENRLDYMG
jgi:uncharacterized protein (TIGR02284 family)